MQGRMGSGRLLVAAMVAFALAGCVEVWDNLRESVGSLAYKPPTEAPVANGEITDGEIAALAAFETAAGKTAAGETDEAARAVRYMTALAEDVIRVLSDRSVSRDAREAHFRQLLGRDLDIPLIARFAAGRSWRAAEPDQRRAYLAAFRDFVVTTYARRLGGVDVDRFDVIDTRPVGKRDIVVRSRVAKTGDRPVRADWRLRQRDGRFRILDISLEGISMALTLRQEFASVLRRAGSLDGLTDSLKQKTT